MKNLSKEIIQEHLLTELQSQAQDSKVSIQENSLGGLILQIVTSIFENRAWTEREALIDSLLEPLDLDLGQSPIFDYTLLTLSEKAQEPSPQNRSVWLLYDELDTGFGEESYARRKRALEALLAQWLESGASLGSITPKIFLREDIWRRLNFENKGHYSSKTLLLKWEEADLWRLILRQSLNKSLTFKNLLQERLNVTIDQLETLELSQLRKSLYPLWGERMGRGKKAFTCNWIRTRISDSNGNSFPRSLVLLLEQAVEQEKKFDTEYSADIILRPKALTTAFPRVSE